MRNQKGVNNNFYGKHHTEETKIKLSEMFKGKHRSSYEFKKGMIPWSKNHIYLPPISKEELFNLYIEKCMSSYALAEKFHVQDQTIRNWLRKYGIKIRDGAKGSKKSENAKKRISENHWTKNPRWKDKFENFKTKYAFKKGMVPWCAGLTKENHPGLKKISKFQTERWNNDEIRAARIKKWIGSNQISPTKPELKFIELCKKYNLPYDYVGDGKVILGGFIPDFVNNNGKKQVVLIHGVYWHLWRLQKKNSDLTREMIENKEKQRYKKIGNFDCKVIWEDELRDENVVLNKLGALII